MLLSFSDSIASSVFHSAGDGQKSIKQIPYTSPPRTTTTGTDKKDPRPDVEEEAFNNFPFKAMRRRTIQRMCPSRKSTTFPPSTISKSLIPSPPRHCFTNYPQAQHFLFLSKTNFCGFCFPSSAAGDRKYEEITSLCKALTGEICGWLVYLEELKDCFTNRNWEIAPGTTTRQRPRQPEALHRLPGFPNPLPLKALHEPANCRAYTPKVLTPEAMNECGNKYTVKSRESI